MQIFRTHLIIVICSFFLSTTFFGCNSPQSKKSETNMITSLEKVEKSAPEWSKNATIYEVNLRQYTKEGTVNAFAKDLPRLKDLGVKILWFMPIHPIGEKNRKGTLGSYYAVKDYKAFSPEHGTLDDFKNVVKKAHEMGMYVIIDWVANHTAWDNVWVKKNPDWFTKDSLGNFVPPVPDWHDVIDLNYDNHEMRKAMIDALKFWVKEVNVDGFRCDVAGLAPNDFWNAARFELDKIKPVFMLAEWNEPHIHGAFDMSYSSDFHHVMNDIAKGKKDATAIPTFFENEEKKYAKDAYRMQFITNHDENSWNGTIEERLGEAAEAMTVLYTTVPGMPLIYAGQEAGNDKRLEFFEKDVIEWKTHPNRELLTTLFQLNLENSALWNGEYGGEINWLNVSDNKNAIAFTRQKGNDKVLIIINLSNKMLNFKISGENLIGSYKNVFNTTDVTELSDSVNLKLSAWEYRVYSSK